LGLTRPSHVSRRWYYFVPREGPPRGLVHRVETGVLESLPGAKAAYSSWPEHRDGLRALLNNAKRVAMQYSPFCAIPSVANVDAGTVELVRSFGAEVISSAELIQRFEARWSSAMLDMHLEAGRRVDRVRSLAFEFVREARRHGKPTTEYAVQQFVLQRFAEAGLVTNSPPIVGVNANASDPHYQPTQQ